ncbi:MAG: hypothetical protein B7Y36_07585 [Novosphingobium sp. 28-62-57]|uniref:DUF2309 domain-containing protein n=1 Tax=unclassified Novosphingobium TaxID=2644732 RepID=UPI000BC4F2E5|nr:MULTISPECIES: DUF2309 domain-containing protein [unclassified Novosphingobium]OYW47795.1 MAG: hypothetical protein B7Z36_00680 [Novosphingobium sp. 12-63-9]OYZ10687.1 MAG: hypothetical protein B7Y36_07585 [Novosphingobium sp. 28-62-57]OZA33078.1 MAG: hypothetical protein B7X92_11745 [Novosphingobium sp. 17-62-9]HQS70523.1 DUF2309 domain-containing protein [Novosphingobium sp.]
MNLATGTFAAETPFNALSSTSTLQAEREQLLALASIAAQTVAPLWPLNSAIAVNPLSGFEDLPFEEALPEAATLFGARPSLSLTEWRKLMAEGRIEYVALRKAIVQSLGGLEEAFAPLGPDLNAYNLLVARLTEMNASDAQPERNPLSPAMAVLARWLATFFDRNAALRLPKRECGLYACLREVLQHDPALLRISDTTAANWLAKAPADPVEMLLFAARRDAVAQDQRLPWLRSLVAAMPGWGAHLRWRAEHAGHEASLGAPATMLDLMALVALLQGVGRPGPAAVPETENTQAVEAALLAHFGFATGASAQWTEQGRAKLKAVASYSLGELGLIFQQAAEASFLAALAPQLEGASARLTAPQSTLRPEAQAVFCIDVRSEPMRRALEAQGRFETLGYAGFFGLPIAINPACAAPTRNQLPVLLSPSHVVPERAAPGREAEAGALLARHAAMDDAQAMLDTTKSGATGFATAEAAGPIAAVAMLARTLAPRLTNALTKRLMGERGHSLVPVACNDHGHDGAHGLGGGIPLEQQIAYARGMFALTGLSAQTARLVALVGHGGCTTNNAFAASLDCGACGGHPGGPNARLMAAILNTPAVREGLAEQGVALPEDTWFIAAQHDTTRDAVEIFDRQLVPASHAGDLARFEKALEQAGGQSRQERATKLGRTAEDLLTGAAHWAEVRPEWGLAGNAAFIIAPRALTQEVDLGGQAFLHSYDWKQDKDGSALTGIMTAPMIVAQWINCQYLFSTIDNAVFGAGDKTTQNVIGGFGVVQGSGGDLCTGLPRQSLFRDDGTAYHTPRRLAVIVEAPLQRVQDIVLAHDAVGRLVENGWINLVVIDPWKHKAHHWVRGDWAAQPC